MAVVALILDLNLNALKSSCLTPLPFLYINPRLEQPPPEFKYKEGKGVKQDDFKAFKFFQKACDLNYGSGCFNLGLVSTPLAHLELNLLSQLS
jgi:hypothetical protein